MQMKLLMKTILTICDRCGAKTHLENAFISLKVADQPINHLCPVCTEDYKRFMKNKGEPLIQSPV